MRILVLCAAWAFPLHWLWETGHGVAYVETRLPLFTRVWHCLPIAVVDTGWSVGLVAAGLFLAAVTRRKAVRWWATAVGGVLTAAVVEQWAVREGRWTYNELMPIIPLVRVGLWPVLQMGLVTPLTLWISERRTPSISPKSTK